MKKVMLVFGTRPEAIKMAPLVKEFQKYPDKFETIVCVTGQHRQMLDQVLQLFGIVPDYDLDIMKPGQDLYDITSRILIGMRDVFKQVVPDVLLVHGDTTTSMSAALAAFYKQIPVGHVEAGLRTHNIYSPWPEEINRQITSRIAVYNFAPTKLSYDNLRKEEVREETITITGNTVIDALHYVVNKLEQDMSLSDKIKSELQTLGLPEELLNSWGISRRLVLVTGHRRENFGDGFLHICQAIKILAERYPETDFVYPVHLNPNVQKPVNELLSHIPNVHLIKPLEYLPFVYLMKCSYFILTDSGGVQEEAPGLGKPVLVMRDTTERPEAVDAGTVKLVGTDVDEIVQSSISLFEDKLIYRQMSEANNPYGDGKATERIINVLK
ncbi:non-hydrolyzing UDP-N-acetylglucosamine 2-epimerase [Parabacteroides johnsonii]|uniref:non-hydrolyzing UDP-N-acetylglucosamine 2-epimerase n=1 Tax=Parabacteroides johnsonii TaxID=387661 RepID=UPI0011DE0F3A|nr:UDP-N-acetylglucosamine 2-epimerase (non-hydrolyzing) [Parabacteroides johnsonii]